MHALVVLLGVSFCTFCCATLVPGNYVDDLRLNPQISSETLHSMSDKYGLEAPLGSRYLRWFVSVCRGDFGFSLAYKVPVRQLLVVRIGNTLLLTITAALVSCSLALVIGLWQSQHRGRFAGRLLSSVIAAFMAIPDTTIALVLLFIALRTGWFPTGGMAALQSDQFSAWQRVLDVGHHLALPAGVLVLSTLPVLTRHVQSAMSEAWRQPYVRAAQALGIAPLRFLCRHVLAAGAAPLVSLLGFVIGSLLSCSLLVEALMGWPGLGSLLLESALARDFDVVVGGVLASTACFVAGNFLADLVLYFLDPRIRVEPQVP
jgi:peptide/nickel transport system permease protein